MQAFVYKSLKKADTYVYLAARDDFARLPDALRARLAPFAFVLELALVPGRRLARGNEAVVRGQLVLRGYHLQLPEGSEPDPMTEDWGTDA